MIIVVLFLLIILFLANFTANAGKFNRRNFFVIYNLTSVLNSLTMLVQTSFHIKRMLRTDCCRRNVILLAKRRRTTVSQESPIKNGNISQETVPTLIEEKLGSVLSSQTCLMNI